MRFPSGHSIPKARQLRLSPAESACSEHSLSVCAFRRFIDFSAPVSAVGTTSHFTSTELSTVRSGSMPAGMASGMGGSAGRFCPVSSWACFPGEGFVFSPRPTFLYPSCGYGGSGRQDFPYLQDLLHGTAGRAFYAVFNHLQRWVNSMRHERPFQWRRTEQHGNAWFLVALVVLILLAFASAATMPIPG